MSINIDSVSLNINDVNIIKDISFTMNPGELITILGPNGSGKSTLLRVISGDLLPTKGEVTIDNVPLSNMSFKTQALKRSVMSQSQQILYDYSVQEIIEMGWVDYADSSGVELIKQKCIKAAKDCFVDHLLKRKFNRLSGGEQRMVHFARTLLQSNGLQKNLQKYIFFDEPTANLDIKRELNILNVIRKKAKEGFGIFVVLHDLNLAYNFSDRIILIKDGKINKMGDPNDVFKDEILSEVYEVPVYFDKDIGRIRYY